MGVKRHIYWATPFCKRQGKQKLMVRFTSEYRHPVWIGSLSKLVTFYWPPIGRGCLRNFFLSVVVFLVSTPFQQYNTIQKLIYTDLIFSAYPFIERERNITHETIQRFDGAMTFIFQSIKIHRGGSIFQTPCILELLLMIQNWFTENFSL